LHSEILETLNDTIPLSILQKLCNLENPPFIATDGLYVTEDSESINSTTQTTTGAAVLCTADIRKHETFVDTKWTDRQAIPIFARSNFLPKMIGASKSDISHSEGIRVRLGIEMIENHNDRFLIMDSTSVRSTIISLRDNFHKTALDRKYIRQTISGIGKNICNRVELNFKIRLDSNNTQSREHPRVERQISEFLKISVRKPKQ